MRQRSIALFGLIGAAVVASVAWALWSGAGDASTDASTDASSARRSAARAPTLRWNEGDCQAYDVLVDSESRVRVDVAFGAQSVHTVLDGRLHMRVAAVTDDAVRVVFRLARAGLELDGQANPSAASSAALGEPFGVVYERSGRLREVVFSAAHSEDARDLLEDLVRSFQVTVPPSSRSDLLRAWTAEEEENGVLYTVAYRLGDDGAIHKAKARGVGQGGLDVDIERSAASIRTAAPSGSWIDEMRVSEVLTARAGPTGSFRSELRARLRRVAAAAAREAALADAALHGVDASFAGLLVVDAPSADPAQATDPAAEPGDPQVVRDLVAQLDDAGGHTTRLFVELRDYLRAHPELTSVVLELLGAPERAADTDATLILALERAGTPQAGAALVTILQDGARSPDNRLRAVIALGGLDEPGAQVIAALWRAFEGRSGGPTDGVHDAAARGAGADPSALLGDAATLALGRVGNGLRGRDPDAYRDVRSRLLDELGGATRENDTSNLLMALGNTGDDTLVPAVAPYLAGNSPAVRKAAARAMRWMDTGAALDALADRLVQEPAGGVRAAVASSMDELTTTSDRVLNVVDSLVLREPDPSARYAMTRYLGERVAAYPRGRTTLQQLLRQERSERILKYASDRLLETR